MAATTPTSPLAGRLCVVTGASSGIGAALVKQLHASGARVVAAARRTDKLDDIAAQCAKSALSEEASGVFFPVHCVRCDVTVRDDVKKLAKEAEEHDFGSGSTGTGKIDVWVSNAGLMQLSPWEAMLEDEWDAMIDVNVKGVLNGVGAVLPGMLERGAGHLVHISSDAGRKVFPTGGAYCASKWAVEAITQSLRLEHAGKGVHFLSVQPGATRTELAGHATHAETKAFIEKGTMPLLEADDVARAVVFALSQPANCSINEILLRPEGQGQ
jgi:NADP-dependent 3-hydroxy acid dehydrogenase YdfG